MSWNGSYKTLNIIGRTTIFLMSGTGADKVGRRHAIFVTSVLDLSSTEIEGEDSKRIRVLVGDEQVLTRVIKLIVARRLSSSVKVSHCDEFSLFGSLVADLEDGDGLVTTIGNDNESSRVVYADTTASVHSGGECNGKGADGLDQAQRGASLVFGHIVPTVSC